MNCDRWNEWDRLWTMKRMKSTLVCEINKDGMVVRSCKNISTTEVGVHKHKQDSGTRWLHITDRS